MRSRDFPSRCSDLFHKCYGVFANAVDHFLSVFRSINHQIKVCEKGGIPLGSRKKICFFSHYDAEGKVDDYVLFYLQQLEACGFEIVFTSTSPKLDLEHREKIRKYCALVILRTNVGLDFGSWKVGLSKVSSISKYEQVLLSNDSVYGPFHSLQTVFDSMSSREVDIWGITESQETDTYHLQSYFLVFQRNAITRNFLVHFLKRVRLLKRKWGIILNYEIGLSRKAISNRLKLGCYCSYESLGPSDSMESGPLKGLQSWRKVNPTHFFWKELLKEAKSPFVKVDLLRNNPQQIQDVPDWQNYLAPDTHYPLEVIEAHLQRIRPHYQK